jgi:hypothetical protein
MILALRESDIKATCESYLNILRKEGKLVYLRLNSGKLIIGEGNAKRAVLCCPKGTSDEVVIISKPLTVIFVEYKRPGEKQTREQRAFDVEVCSMGFEYWLVYDSEAFFKAIQEILK